MISSLPKHQTSLAFAGQATFDGGLAILGVARETLTSRLPPSTVLHDVATAYHPCVLAFGRQENGTTFFGGLPMPWGVDYHELLVGVPFVRRLTEPIDHLFVLGMICDSWPAIWNGNFYYGFQKRFALMRWADDAFVVTGGSGREELHATLSDPKRDATPTFDFIRTIVTQPVLGWRERGGFVNADFDWDFSTASIESASLQLAFEEPFRELAASEAIKILGQAYRVRGMRWRLSWPRPATIG